MKPQILVSDYGRHNLDLEKTRSRLLEGTSWKNTRVVVMMPAGKDIPTKVAFSLWNLIFPPNQAHFKYLCMGMEVGEAYSSAIENLLATPGLNEFEYILTVEHDNVPQPDGLLKLISQMEAHPEFACIGGLYFTKGPEGVAQIWGDPNDPIPNYRPQVPVPGKLIECCGTGMGFNLWRLSMFKDERLRRPWFKTQAGLEGVGTQDLYFWNDARKFGYRCAIDCSVLVGHYDKHTDITW